MAFKEAIEVASNINREINLASPVDSADDINLSSVINRAANFASGINRLMSLTSIVELEEI